MTRALARTLQSILLTAPLAVGCGDVRPLAQSPAASRPPQRIVSMAPSVTEVLFALGLGQAVVGVTRFCDYPPEARERAQVGGYLDPNYEAVVALAPDLVVLIQDQDEIRQRLTTLGLASLQVDQHDVEGVLGSIVAIADRCGVRERGTSLAEEIRDQLRRVGEIARDRTRPRVLIVVERELGSGSVTSLWAAGPSTFYDDLVRLAGGRNVVVEAVADYPELSREALSHLDPDVILDVIPDMATRDLDAAVVAADWQALSEVRAVREGRVHLLADELMVIPGPRIGLAVEQVARALFPEMAIQAGGLPPTPAATGAGAGSQLSPGARPAPGEVAP